MKDRKVMKNHTRCLLCAGGLFLLAAPAVLVRAQSTLTDWGRNHSGQLGENTTTQRETPAQVSGVTRVAALAAGRAHSLMVKSSGAVWAWGYNYYGQLGDGTRT